MKLDNKFSIKTDSEGCTLIFAEKRTRKTKEGETVEYMAEDKYYYSNIEQCIRKYLQECIKPSKDVKDCLIKIEEALEIINNLSVV